MALKTHLTDADAIVVGDLLGYVESSARRMGKRFYGYLKGEIKNWNYDDNVEYGKLAATVLPALSHMIKRGYFVPVLNEA